MYELKNRRHDIFGELFPPSARLINEYIDSVFYREMRPHMSVHHQAFYEAVTVWLIEAGYSYYATSTIMKRITSDSKYVYEKFLGYMEARDKVSMAMWQVVLMMFGDPKNGQDRPSFQYLKDTEKYERTRIRAFNNKIRRR